VRFARSLAQVARQPYDYRNNTGTADLFTTSKNSLLIRQRAMISNRRRQRQRSCLLLSERENDSWYESAVDRSSNKATTAYSGSQLI